MALDLIPRRFLSFPTLPSIWDDDDDWLTLPSTQSGLSISEDDKHVYVEAAVPGIDPKDVDITYQDGYVWIRGETKQEEKDPRRKYYRQATQVFSYRVAVPGDVDSKVEPEADCKNGMMVVTFAKSPVSQPKKIKVKSV